MGFTSGYLNKQVGAILPLLPLLGTVFATHAYAGSCESLASVTLQNTTILAAQPVPAGGFSLPATPGKQNNAAAFKDLPAFCRVTASIKPTSDSDIRIEVWMPASGWNGELRGNGNGGLGGGSGVSANALANALRGGFATVGSNTGHEGGPEYALDHPEKIVDFGDRAAHEMTVKAKALVEAFYGAAPKFSYMNECGGGTISALKEAQKYPADYDGIVAGGFAAHLTRHTFAQMWIWQATHKEEGSTIPPAKLPVLHDAVLAACDKLDGVKDGVLEDPTRCKFDPGTIQCKGADGPSCLTSLQVDAARKLYAGPVNPRTRKQLYSGLFPGSELGWAQIAGPQPINIATDFFKFFVFRDPAWDYRTRPVNFDTDVAAADRADIQAVNSVDPDLRKFAARGGKLILHEGWNDASVPPGEAIDYYKNVLARAGAKNTKESVRLYMVPGMAHCNGGEGTDTFDTLAAIRQWVEQKKAPEQIMASRVVDGKTVRTRPLCPYPEVAVYKGTGSTDDGANFACKAR